MVRNIVLFESVLSFLGDGLQDARPQGRAQVAHGTRPPGVRGYMQRVILMAVGIEAEFAVGCRSCYHCRRLG